MQTNKVLLFFETETGGEISIPINNGKDTMTLAEIESIATDIITENVFFSKTGDLKSFRYARNVTTITTDIL